MRTLIQSICAAACAAFIFTACEPVNTPNPTPDLDGDETVMKLQGTKIEWPADTTVILDRHLEIGVDQSLYIHEGATVIADNAELKPEIVVLGNLYVLGTEKKPVTFTVEESSRANRFSRNWGGIICGYDSKEVVLENAIIEYGGAQTTEESLSFRHKLFKTETGEGVPAFHFCNPQGQFVIVNCTFRYNAEDHTYITGGKSIMMNNRFICNGFDGGEAINYKSECLADIANNLIYDANTNGFKLSNGGFVNVQSHLICYNNTMVNCGWRRPKVKGGCIWLEDNIWVELYNNLMYDCRWGLKESVEEPMDQKSIITPNYYFASTQTGWEQMQPTEDEEEGIRNGADDIMSEKPGDKDPLFANYTQQENVNVNVGANEGDIPQEWNDAWDFSLKAGSPAAQGGKTDFTRHYGTKGLTFATGKTYASPEPAEYFGAFGVK